ncbi:MAG TPA: NHL repeat-containing protein [Verrucomicrobiae bacterium]|nr:NHL repeat-containing protein [Verrucomicrobiae bacterium]
MRGHAFLLGTAGLLLGGAPAFALDLAVADFQNNTVQIINSGGTTISVLSSPLLDGPMGVSYDDSGNLYVGNFYNNTIVKFNPAGHASLFATTALNEPRGLVCDANGNVYVANYNGNDVVKFNSQGQASFFAGASAPTGLALDSQGNLFVAGQGGYVDKFNTVTGMGTLFALPGGAGPGPEGLAFDPAGNLYVADYGGNSIYKYNANGVGGFFASTGGGYTNPFGLAYAGGILYASCNVDEIEQFASSGGTGGYFASTLNGPWFIAVQPTPEPSTIVILLAGLTGYCSLSARRPRNVVHRLRFVKIP